VGVCPRVLHVSAVSPEFYLVLDPETWKRRLGVLARNLSTPAAADWKRPPGRPRRNWLQQVEEDVGLSVGAAWIAGQDRSMWRTLRPSAGQAQQ